MTLRIAIDTGGTFTDVVAINEESGQQFVVKTPSTPDDPSVGLLSIGDIVKAVISEKQDHIEQLETYIMRG